MANYKIIHFLLFVLCEEVIMTKFLYRKILGLFMVIVGLSYCFTSFHNFYSYLFGDITIANANIYLMSLGLVFPLYVFIFGIFFYLYRDKEFGNINPFVLITSILMFVVGVSRIFVSNGIMEFIHFSFSIPIIILSILLFYGCIRYKY